MKAFLAVVGAGLLLLAGEAAWVGSGRGGRPRRAGSLVEAERTVSEYLAATRALQDRAGDPRLADRVPAVPELVSEGLAAMAFAERRLGVTERHELVRMEPVASRWLPEGGAEVRTREYWVHRAARRDGSGDPPAPVSSVCDVRYDLVRDGSGWRVLDFRLYPEPDDPGDR